MKSIYIVWQKQKFQQELVLSFGTKNAAATWVTTQPVPEYFFITKETVY